MTNADTVKTAQSLMSQLNEQLQQRDNQSTELLNITDVLTQVEKTVAKSKNPEALVNRVVNYVRSESLAGKITFPKNEETLMIELGEIGQKAGLNGAYMADFSDKSQFYGIKDEMPVR